MEALVYQVWEKSRNDPDSGPKSPAKKGMWVWWRTGEHPQGVWQAMDLNGSTEQGKAGLAAWHKNQADFPIWQDKAQGDPSDFGNVACHACDYLSDGYPEPNHYTACDGICRRVTCNRHGKPGKEAAVKNLTDAFAIAVSLGMSEEEIKTHINSLTYEKDTDG